MAVLGQWRYADHRSIPAIHPAWRARRIAWAPRTVTPRLEREDALGALALPDTTRLQHLTPARGRVIFARAGLPPDVSQAVLWGWRACLSGEVLLHPSQLKL
jgi:hypothetical protein